METHTALLFKLYFPPGFLLFFIFLLPAALPSSALALSPFIPLQRTFKLWIAVARLAKIAIAQIFTTKCCGDFSKNFSLSAALLTTVLYHTFISTHYAWNKHGERTEPCSHTRVGDCGPLPPKCSFLVFDFIDAACCMCVCVCAFALRRIMRQTVSGICARCL